jgi:hypothetical protein
MGLIILSLVSIYSILWIWLYFEAKQALILEDQGNND